MATNASNATSAALGNILTNAGSQSQNTFLAAPSGSSGLITGRLIVGADLPLPSPSSLGAAFSFAEITSPEQFLVSLGTDGNFNSKQVAFSMLAGMPSAADLLISAGSGSNPTGLAPVNGDCVFGAGGAWTAGSCGGSASITASSPNIVVAPSPCTTGACTVGATNPEIGQSAASVTFSGTTACTTNTTPCYPSGQTIESTDTANQAYGLPVASTTGYTPGFAFQLIAPPAHTATVTPNTSNVAGLTSLTIPAGDTCEFWTLTSSVNYWAACGSPTPPPASGTSGGILGYTAANTLASSAVLGSGQIVIGGGAGATPTSDASATLNTGALSLGASGTAGSVAMGNATSGVITLQPVAGALGTVTASLPANAGTIAELNLKQSWTAAQRQTPTNIAISTATFTPNFDTAQNFEIDLTSACPCTLANPSTSLVAGQSGVIEIHQDGTGGRTIGTWGSDYQYAGGTTALCNGATSCSLSTGISAVDYVPYYVNNAATGIVLGSLIKGPTH